MSIIKKGTPFGATEQVTSDKLNNLVDNASFTDTSANAVAYTGSTGTCLNGGGLEVTSAGQLQIEDDGVTQAKTNFIDADGVMTLSGTGPQIRFDDSDYSGTSPRISGNSDFGNLNILAEGSGSDIVISANDVVEIRHQSTPLLSVSDDTGKDQSGNATAGAKVDGGLYVTGDIYADDQVVADHITLKGNQPNITFADDDSSGNLNPEITANSPGGNLAILTKESGSDLYLRSVDNIIFETTDNPGSDYDSSSNDYQPRLFLSHDSGKDSSGNASPGAKVDGDLQVTEDVYVTGTARAAAIKIGSTDILDLIHPVGSVIQTTTNYADSAAVAADYGGTTWTRFSEGRMLAGYKSSDSDFSAGNEDGSKTVTLTESQIPNINGSISIDSWIASTGDFSSTGSPNFYIDNTSAAGPSGSSNRATLDFGGGGSHDNMPPYKVVYMWTRTA